MSTIRASRCTVAKVCAGMVSARSLSMASYRCPRHPPRAVQSSASGYHLASFRVARAFSILSVTSAVVTVCCAFIARAKPPPARRPIFIAFLSALVSFLTGLICMASFAGIPRSFYRAGISGTYSLGPGFAVCVVNWVLQLVVTLIISVLYWNPVSASKEAATSDLMPIAPAPTTTTVTAV